MINYLFKPCFNRFELYTIVITAANLIAQKKTLNIVIIVACIVAILTSLVSLFFKKFVDK